jgi:hypothetical protein
MGKPPQNAFRRFMIMGRTSTKSRQQPAGKQCLGPHPSRCADFTRKKATPYLIRMAVMPAPSARRLFLAAATRVWRFLCAALAVGEAGQHTAAVLSFIRFERDAARAQGLAAAERLLSVKPISAVPWGSYQVTAKQEGGRV